MAARSAARESTGFPTSGWRRPRSGGGFPALRPDEGSACGSRAPGCCSPERCIAAHLELARRSAAPRRARRAGRGWAADGAASRWSPRAGATAPASALAAGPGSAAWPELAPLFVERRAMSGSRPRPARSASSPSASRSHLGVRPGRFFYGFPDLGGGREGGAPPPGRAGDAGGVREVAAGEVEAMRSLARRISGRRGQLRQAACASTPTRRTSTS